MNSKKERHLGAKTASGIILFAIILLTVAIYLGYSAYANSMDDHYKKLSENIAKTAACYIDGETIAGYLDTLEKDDAYFEMLENLDIIRDNNDVRYLYIEKISPDGVWYIMDTDTEEPCELGEYYPLADEFAVNIDKLTSGAYVEPEITDGEYGWLVSYYEPVFNGAGECVAHIGVDISMDDIMADRRAFMRTIVISTVLLSLAMVLLFIYWVRRNVVNPINQMAAATADFISDKQTDEQGLTQIARLDIHTGDEIERLMDSVKAMEQDIEEYIVDLTAVTAEKERIGAELDVAATIQNSMLPGIFPAFPGHNEFDLYATMQTAKEVGGDFYDFFLIDNRHLGIVIADVSGKGVPAALFMVIAKTLIKNHAQLGKDAAATFIAVNEQLCEGNEAGMFVTAWLGILDLETGHLVYANAGHNPPLLKANGGAYEYLQCRPGFVLAGMEGIKYRQAELDLAPGDRLYLYTDGVTEATSLSEELYGEQRLSDVLNSAPELELTEVLQNIQHSIDDFVGEAPQFDDITMLLLEYKGGAPS